MRYIDHGNYVYSFSRVNLDHHVSLTHNELKDRASTLAHSHYKMEKRQYAKYMAKKRLMWIMSVVKAKLFVNKLKKKWQQTKSRKAQEE